MTIKRELFVARGLAPAPGASVLVVRGPASLDCPHGSKLFPGVVHIKEGERFQIIGVIESVVVK